MLLSKKKILNTEICDIFNVSIETVRRDLNYLEKEGIIKKIYGGAILADDSLMPDEIQKWDIRSGENLMAKRLIAKKAAELIPDNCTVMLDTGTTIFEVACQLKNKKNLTVITNSMRIAAELGMCQNITVYLVGGIVKVDVLVTLGFLASEFLSNFSYVDIAVISGDGFIPEEGTMEYSMDLAMLKRDILDKAGKVIAAIDHTKFGVPASFINCPTQKIDILVTDKNEPKSDIEYMRGQGVDVIIAEEESNQI